MLFLLLCEGYGLRINGVLQTEKRKQTTKRADSRTHSSYSTVKCLSYALRDREEEIITGWCRKKE
jgi:hypothetical protein